MNSYQYNDLIVEVINEPTYSFGSADNYFNYSKHYFGDGGTEYATSKHGVRICQGDQIVDNCIVIGSGGATGVHKTHRFLTTTNYCYAVATPYFV